MFKLGKLLGVGKFAEPRTSLNRESPRPDSGTGPETAASSEAGQPSGPATGKTPAEMLQERREMQAIFDQTPMAAVVQQRAKTLLETGPLPKAMYYGHEPRQNVPLGFVSPDKTRGMVLVFSSPVLAHQLFRTPSFYPSDAPFEVREFQLDAMEETARSWKSARFHAVAVNLTAKKTSPAVLDAGAGMITKEMLLGAWAANRVACMILAEAWRKESVSNKKAEAGTPGGDGNGGDVGRFRESLQRQRWLLENLRDMGAADVPFVHWQIALIAGMQGDEEGRLAATAVLEEFGPDFVGKTAPSRDDPKAWADSLTIATLGLLAEFGMLTGPDGKPVESFLRVRRETVAGAD